MAMHKPKTEPKMTPDELVRHLTDVATKNGMWLTKVELMTVSGVVVGIHSYGFEKDKPS